MDQGEHGDDDGEQHALKHAEDEHAREHHQGKAEVADPELADAVQRLQVDQAGDRHDHHRPRVAWAGSRTGGQEQQGEYHHDACGHDPGHLAAGAQLPVDRRLGQSSAGREGHPQRVVSAPAARDERSVHP
jgi:hypothetical protein